MLVLPGPVALSQFRKEGLLRNINQKLSFAQRPTTVLEITAIYVHYVNLASPKPGGEDLSLETSPWRKALDMLLQYEASPDVKNPNMKALVDAVSSHISYQSSL